MARLAKLQLIGPLAVFSAVVCAELAAGALARWPTSETLWRINLAWFQAFQKSSYAIETFETATCSQLWIVAAPLFVLAICGIAYKRPLLLATASNLSFVYACVVLYADCLYSRSWPKGSLPAMIMTSASDILLLVVLVASFLSFLISHVYYIRAIRAGA